MDASNEKKLQYLRRYRELVMEYRDLLDEREAVYGLSTSVTQRIDDMPHGHSGVSDKVGNGAAELAQIEVEIISRLREIRRERTAILRYIGSVRDSYKFYRILYLRHLRGFKYEKIACVTNYDFDYVRKLHMRALDRLPAPPRRR